MPSFSSLVNPIANRWVLCLSKLRQVPESEPCVCASIERSNVFLAIFVSSCTSSQTWSLIVSVSVILALLSGRIDFSFFSVASTRMRTISSMSSRNSRAGGKSFGASASFVLIVTCPVYSSAGGVVSSVRAAHPAGLLVFQLSRCVSAADGGRAGRLCRRAARASPGPAVSCSSGLLSFLQESCEPGSLWLKIAAFSLLFHLLPFLLQQQLRCHGKVVKGSFKFLLVGGTCERGNFRDQ